MCASRISSDEVVTKIMTSIKLIRWLKAPLHLRTFMVKYLLSALLYMSISVGSEQMWKETWIYNESYEAAGILSHQVDETTFQTTLLKSLVTLVLFTSIRPTNFSNNHARFSITIYRMRERYNDEKVVLLVHCRGSRQIPFYCFSRCI